MTDTINVSGRRSAAPPINAVVGAFVAASMGCGLTPSVGALVVARFVQGSAAAIMMPASMALIGQAYPDARRTAAATTLRIVPNDKEQP